jgi:hypothetical protein
VSGLVVGLVPFAYTVRKDKRERAERERADAEKKAADEKRELEAQRERLQATATRYGDLLGKAMALLEAVLVDADNADDLLQGATEAYSDLQGHAQGPLFMSFTSSPPVIWSDRLCRKVLREGLTMAGDARAQRQTGAEALKTQYALRELTSYRIDVAGPRDLFRPKPLLTFKEEPWAEAAARRIQTQIDFEPPP